MSALIGTFNYKEITMSNDSFSKKVMSLSPYIELIIRNIYWRFISHLPKRTIGSSSSINIKFDFKDIISKLKELGVSQGDLLLVHSSYSSLSNSGLKATEIINCLIELLGDEGTLAMPAMPKFKNDQKKEKYLSELDSSKEFLYDVKKSRIKTGLLPAYLHRKKGSIRSLHPINTMVAYGPLASKLMANNISGISPLPCGNNSSWNKCVENNATIIGLGVDLIHSLTMIHVVEDTLDVNWPIKNWYREKKFKIVDGDEQFRLTLRERRPKWGALHFAERTLCKDLINMGILKSHIVSGVQVELINSKELINYLRNRCSTGYPYFGFYE